MHQQLLQPLGLKTLQFSDLWLRCQTAMEMGLAVTGMSPIIGMAAMVMIVAMVGMAEKGMEMTGVVTGVMGNLLQG
jgi:hypothetical protein